MEWTEGDLVWFDPGLGHPLPGEILEAHRAAQVLIVQALINGKAQTFTLSAGEGDLRPRQDLGQQGVEDMTQLQDLHEASLLWNLRLRYDRSLIYTFAGGVLVAINPYKMLPSTYGLETARQYASRPLGALPPHLFAISAAAHAALPAPQVVVVSGESGSGKTESTKLVVQYLAAVAPAGGAGLVTEQILEATPLLEAFGNARTSHNDNSSRFGKYLEVFFKNGSITGAMITQYLLEKSRIVTQAPGERNYHIFYELLGGLTEQERKQYGLLEADKYFYLNQGGSDCAAGQNTADWTGLRGAMQVLGVSEEEQQGIVRVLASVLHLGNVYFHRRQLRHGQEGVELGSDAEIKWAAHLLQISPDGLQRALTTRVTETRTERLHTPLGIDQALDARDAFAKALYSGLFNWLVSRVNSIVHRGGMHDAHRISILDIFGFEDVTENSFEQLCINYANESLQLYFNRHVFKLEQQEYTKERLEWTALTWEDNLPVIHLLSKKPVGVLHLLDDESNFPRASDRSFLEKCHYNHALNELYARPRVGAQEFGISHYAGQVWYNAEGFLEKNRDDLRPEILDLLSSSNQTLVSDLTRRLRAQRDAGRLSAQQQQSRGSDGRFVTMKPRTPTVAARFCDSLHQLLTSMSKCNPWFVRCIRPNAEKQALRMDMPCVLRQLRCLGLLDTVRIRRQGYPARLRFQAFVERYRGCLTAGSGLNQLQNPPPAAPRGTPLREVCRTLLDSLPPTGADGPDYQLGATRVFLREGLHRQLEAARSERRHHAAIRLQAKVRGFLARKRWRSKRSAAVLIQKAWRGHYQHKKYQATKRAAIKAQALYRGKLQRRRYSMIKTQMKRRAEAEKAARERMAQRIAREQAARSPALHLDIPAELAFIFSKLDGWQPPHTERHLVKVLGSVVGPPPVQAPSLSDLGQYTFGKFSSVYCNGIELGVRRDPILVPFLSRAAARDRDFQDALAVFKLLLRWTGDPSLQGAKEKALADYVVHKGLTSRGLRDEILVQLCNQTWRNENSDRIWQLMSHCLSAFHPGLTLNKYLLKYVSDHAPAASRELLLRKLLRPAPGPPVPSARLFPPSQLEWCATQRRCDTALTVTLPDGTATTVAVDSWTTCEEAAALAVSPLGISPRGWTVALDDAGLLTDCCGLDYILDPLAEREMCPAFPTTRVEAIRCGARDERNAVLMQNTEPQSPRRPQVPPPEPPPIKTRTKETIPQPVTPVQTRAPIEPPPRTGYSSPAESTTPQSLAVTRKTSHEMLSRSSALNERYFETEKSRSRSLDDLLAGGEVPVPNPEPPLAGLGLSQSRLNDRYHSAERLEQAPKPGEGPRYVKSQYPGKRAIPGSHSSKAYIERSELGTGGGAARSSAMSDTSEAPSLASHVRRVRVPSQASDVDQFLDELFSPVLDGSLDELSDARSLAASIRGGRDSYLEAPTGISNILSDLGDAKSLVARLKGGGQRTGPPSSASSTLDQEVAALTAPTDSALDEYITDLFQPIFVNDSLRRLTEKSELVNAIKGGGTAHQTGAGASNFVLSPPPMMMMGGAEPFMPLYNMQGMQVPQNGDLAAYQQQMQRAFLQSAMAQNIQIQQQLLAQNQALQTLLSQQDPSVATTEPTRSTHQSPKRPSFKKRNSPAAFTSVMSELRSRRTSSESGSSLMPPPPPPPMPPPLESSDPSEARPFLDPYGRAKTVRIGKWRWPPPQGAATADQNGEDFIQFKMRQQHRKTTPQSQQGNAEWDDETDSMPASPAAQETQPASAVRSSTRRSFEIGAERPPPGSVGKLKLSSEMRQRLEQVTAGHSIRSAASTRSERPARAPAKLEDARRMMLEQQLAGAMNNIGNGRAEPDALPSVRTQVQRMEHCLPPAPPGPAPPAPARPPSSVPPVPPPPAPVEPQSYMQKRQERDTFGVHQNREYGYNWEVPEVERNGWSGQQNGFREYDNKQQDRNNHRDYDNGHRDFESYTVSDQHDGSSNDVAPVEVRRTPPQKRIMSQPKPTERATYRTHMAQRNAQERDRRSSTSTHFTSDKQDGADGEDWPSFLAPVLPAPSSAPSVINPEHVSTLNQTQSPQQPAPSSACITYHRVPWRLRVRKEVFSPGESLGSAASLDLLFQQVALDVLGNVACLRIAPGERRAANAFLSGHRVTADSLQTQQHRAVLKKHLVEMARGWPLYFARLFHVNGAPQLPEVNLLAVSHSGVYLVRRDHTSGQQQQLTVIRAVPFSELASSSAPAHPPATLQLALRGGARVSLHAIRAGPAQQMIAAFCAEHRKVQGVNTSSRNAPVVEQRTTVPPSRSSEYNTTPNNQTHTQQHNQQHNQTHSQTHSQTHTQRHTPQSHTQQSHTQSDIQPHTPSRNSAEAHLTRHSSDQALDNGRALSPQPRNGHQQESSPHNQTPHKYPLLQFAARHFRHNSESAQEKGDQQSQSGWWQQSELVRWQGRPLDGPLLRLPPDLAALAVECFDCILRYCGDLPPDPELTEVKCVYTVLMHCHKHADLRDEVYCQLMKQTTANRSTSPDSGQRAWRLLSVLTAYFGCSDALRSFLLEHLGAAAGDRRRPCHGTAAVCLANLRKTARCGGRKNVPSVEEVTAVSAGRSARRQIYRLPGGAERVVNTRCSTVVADVVSELCSLLGVEGASEQSEFSLYCIVQGDAFTMPLAADEYILDVTTELLKSGQPFYLIFCRSVWHHPLRADPGALYTEVLFNQVAPDYLEGLLLELPAGGAPAPEVVRDIARVAALLHRAADLHHVPTMKEIKFLLPKSALGLRELRPAQWVSLVQAAWTAAAPLAPYQVKAQVLHVLSTWPLFGSSFFAVKRAWTPEGLPSSGDDGQEPWRELILALNRRGVLFLEPNSHETLQHWPFSDVISTRKVRSEDGALFLDMKCGSLLQQHVTRLQTEQAHEISRLVRQYITLAQGKNTAGI